MDISPIQEQKQAAHAHQQESMFIWKKKIAIFVSTAVTNQLQELEVPAQKVRQNIMFGRTS